MGTVGAHPLELGGYNPKLTEEATPKVQKGHTCAGRSCDEDDRFNVAVFIAGASGSFFEEMQADGEGSGG